MTWVMEAIHITSKWRDFLPPGNLREILNYPYSSQSWNETTQRYN